VISNSYGTRESEFSQEYADAYHRRHVIVRPPATAGSPPRPSPPTLPTSPRPAAPSYPAPRKRGYTEQVWNNARYLPAHERCGNDYPFVAKPGYNVPPAWATPNGTGPFYDKPARQSRQCG
jgi:hypothetical protein